MKKPRINKFQGVLRSIFIILFLLSINGVLYSQPGMPPGHGQNGNQGGGGMAPLGEGLFFLLAGALVYGIKKLRSEKKEKREE
jgi:hypothetical protein